MHGTEYDSDQSLVALNQLACIDWSVLTTADPGDEPLLHSSMEPGVASTFLSPKVPYRTPASINFTTTSRLTEDYFRSPGSLARIIGAPESSTNIELVEIPGPLLANSSTVLFSIGPPVAALSSAVNPPVQPSAPAPVVATSATIAPSVVPASFLVVQHSTAKASQVVGSSSILAYPSSPSSLGVLPAAPFVPQVSVTACRSVAFYTCCDI